MEITTKEIKKRNDNKPSTATAGIAKVKICSECKQMKAAAAEIISR